MSHRIESRIISRLAAARMKGEEAFRSAVERAVDYALTVNDVHLQVRPELPFRVSLGLGVFRQLSYRYVGQGILLGKVLIETDLEMELVEQTLRSRQEQRLHEQRRHRRPAHHDDWQAHRVMEAALVTCGQTLVHTRHLSSSSPSSGGANGQVALKCLSQHRLIGATSVYLRAASFARFFGAARELASSSLAQFEDFNAGGGGSVDEHALRHCVFLRQRLQVCARSALLLQIGRRVS